jgi:hypothetical protein
LRNLYKFSRRFSIRARFVRTPGGWGEVEGGLPLEGGRGGIAGNLIEGVAKAGVERTDFTSMPSKAAMMPMQKDETLSSHRQPAVMPCTSRPGQA